MIATKLWNSLLTNETWVLGATTFVRATISKNPLSIFNSVDCQSKFKYSSAGCQYANCHYPKCHYPKWHYPKCHCLKCHFVVCHYVKCHHDELHNA